MKTARWAIFISGRGSNAAGLFEELFQLNVVLCVSSKPRAQGLLRAKRAGVPILILDRNTDWESLNKDLQKRRVNRIFLLGFMRILPAEFVDLWQNRILNLHPSLLPEFPGKDALKLSYESGCALGVSIHEVVAEMDAGPLIWQKKVQEKAFAGRHTLTSSDAHFLISRTEQSLVRRSAASLNIGHMGAKEVSRGN